jgi:predicted DNA-binding WGR domain protein
LALKLARQTKLHFQQGNSDKVYEVDLCEAGEGEFLVNFRYGRRGAVLREGTKTPFPMSRSQAEAIFDALVTEKTAKGYQITAGTGTVAPQPKTVRTQTPENVDPRRVAIAKRLADEATGRAKKKSRWKLSRVIWRAGAWKMTETADSIAALVPQMKSEIDFWCAAWALGRCGDAKHAVVLELIAERAKSVPWVLSMVAEARAALLPDQSIPLDRPDPSRLEHELRSGSLDEAGQRELVLLAGSQPAMREVVHELVRCLPIQRGTMAFFRQVLKSAEFRLDAELYGQVVRRIEQSKANPYNYSRRNGIPLAAFPSSTRDYLRRRVIRNLQVMGESGDPALFIPLATGVLVAFDDAVDGPQESSTVTYTYDRATRRSVEHRIWSPRYANRLGFTWLLRGAGGNVEMNALGTLWRCKPGERGDAKGREEPFPALWDQAPDAVMHLLRHARSAEAQRFALRVWRANPNFLEEADGGLIGDLLASWFPETVVLGLEIARAKWDAAQPDLKLLLAMLDSTLDEARTQGVAWLREAAAILQGDGDFLAGVAFLAHEDARIGVREVLRAMPLGKSLREEVVARVLSGLLALDDEAAAGRATDWLEFIAPEEVAALPDGHVAALAGHPLEACQLLAVRILLKRGSPSGLPESLLMAALSSEYAAVRSLGMELLGQLRDDELAKRVETLAACAVSRHAELRILAGGLLKRAAVHDRDAARQLVEQWWPLLFRKEDFEGLHASVYEALTGSFAAELDVIPAGTFRQMLESKYGFGQELGFALLKREVTNPELTDAVEWSVHPLVALRGWSREHLDKEALRGDPAHVLKLLEGPYDDSREWAFEFCRTGLKDGDWSPEALVALCDSNQPAVRTFGRELVTRLFREEDGPLYLARLSQHPTVEVQEFATNYLERFASGQPERIAELDLYFRTVLSRIGAGRVAKRRVLAFLEKEALANERAAGFVTTLLARQAGTVAIQDKAEMIRILDALRRAWPDMAGPLKVKPVEIYQPS